MLKVSAGWGGTANVRTSSCGADCAYALGSQHRLHSRSQAAGARLRGADLPLWAALSDSVRAAAGPVLRDLLLFDRYQGPGVESGCKSLAMGLILQDNARTLTDQDADALVERVVAGLGRDHGARIRG